MGCHFLLQCMKVESESEVAQSCPTLSDPMDAAYQAPPSMGLGCQLQIPIKKVLLVSLSLSHLNKENLQTILMFPMKNILCDALSTEVTQYSLPPFSQTGHQEVLGLTFSVSKTHPEALDCPAHAFWLPP